MSTDTHITLEFPPVDGAKLPLVKVRPVVKKIQVNLTAIIHSPLAFFALSSHVQ